MVFNTNKEKGNSALGIAIAYFSTICAKNIINTKLPYKRKKRKLAKASSF